MAGPLLCGGAGEEGETGLKAVATAQATLGASLAVLCRWVVMD